MLNLPAIVIDPIEPFAPCFYGVSTWMKAQVLLIGTILTPGKRVVSEALWVMGLSQSAKFGQYHQVLNRAVWSPLDLAQVLLKLLVKTFTQPGAVLVFGIDPTIERRWGHKIAARGIYRDGVRSSESHFVKASGLRWISLMLLTPIPWAQRIWALPVMTARSPSERYYRQRGRTPQTLLERSLQMLKLLRRWLPERVLVVVGDSAYAALDFLSAMQPLKVTFVTRLRLDAALYEPAPPYSGKGRPRKKGKRLPTPAQVLKDPDTNWMTIALPWYDGQVRDMQITSARASGFHFGKPALPIRWVLVRDPQREYEPLALLATDPTAEACSIVTWFVQRWQLEVTFEEARRHLGVETQRQWSDKAIARTTPLLLGLFSWVALVAHAFYTAHPFTAPRQTAWYAKPLPTFSDALALVRHCLWTAYPTFRISKDKPDMLKIPKPFFNTLVSTLCYAA
ncbi:MAG: transposase [Acidobacteria bacterium]|nr:transposase [Acidobacteriota bacterium]